FEFLLLLDLSSTYNSSLLLIQHQNIFLLFLFLCCFQLSAQDLSLTIKGKDSTETQLIDKRGYKKKHASVLSIENEIRSILKDFQKEGYINLKSSALEKTKKDASYQIKFNLNKKHTSIKVFYKEEQISADYFKKVNVKYISDYFILPFTNEENQLQANLFLNISDKRIVDSITIKGYDKFPKSYIKNYIRIKKGQVFNKNKLDKKILDLKNLSFVNVPRNPEVLFTKEQTILY